MRNSRFIISPIFRGVVLLSLTIASPGHAADAQSCLRKIALVAKRSAEIAYAIAKPPLKTVYFPVVALKAGVDSLLTKDPEAKPSPKFWQKKSHRWQAGIFASLFALSYTQMTYREFEKATAAFDEAKVAGPTIVTDFFPADDYLYPRAGTYVFEHKYAGTEAKLFANEDMSDATKLVDKVVEHALKFGPLGKIDSFGHGMPGSPAGAIWVPTLYWKYKYADGRSFRPSDLLAPGAQVRINNCFVGNGPHGEDLIAELQERYFTKGGDLYLSAMQMTANPVEYAAVFLNAPKPPDWLREAAQPLGLPLGLWTTAEIIRNRDRVKFPVEARTVIVHIPAEEKRWKADLFGQIDRFENERSEMDWNPNSRYSHTQKQLRKLQALAEGTTRPLFSEWKWAISENGGHHAVAEMSAEEVEKVLDVVNRAKFPGVRAEKMRAYSGVTIDIDRAVFEKEFRTMLDRFEEWRRRLGERGSQEENLWLLKAATDLDARVRDGELTELEGEQAKRVVRYQLNRLRVAADAKLEYWRFLRR